MSAQSIAILGFADIFVEMPFDVTNISGSSFLDATGLSFFAEASANYFIKFSIIYSVPTTIIAGAYGIVLVVNGPASPTSVTGIITVPQQVTPLQGFNSYNDTGPLFSNSAHNGLNHASLQCIFRNGLTAGTFILRFRTDGGSPAVGDPPNSVTIKAKSSLTYRKISL